jgi:hypothetical protein
MSRSGDITASVVYAHSGNPEVYALLRKQGIDVKGKIVLVRYSNPYSYRGFKALSAERAGATAVLVYSDPAEDGYKKGSVFPDGPWGPESLRFYASQTASFVAAFFDLWTDRARPLPLVNNASYKATFQSGELFLCQTDPRQALGQPDN